MIMCKYTLPPYHTISFLFQSYSLSLFLFPTSYPTALAMVSCGLVDVKPLVTHRYSIHEVLEAFHAAKDGAAIKVMIRVDQAQ